MEYENTESRKISYVIDVNHNTVRYPGMVPYGTYFLKDEFIYVRTYVDIYNSNVIIFLIFLTI